MMQIFLTLFYPFGCVHVSLVIVLQSGLDGQQSQLLKPRPALEPCAQASPGIQRPPSPTGLGPLRDAASGGGARTCDVIGPGRAAEGEGAAGPVRSELRVQPRSRVPAPAEMTLAVFFGCTFIAFGPAFGLFIFTIARDPLRIIILIAGAFFWLVSLLLSSLIWFIAVKASDPQDERLQKGLLIFGVMFSVLLQEAFRFLYYKLLRKAIEGLVALSEDGCSPISIQQMAYVAGVGFGLMSGAFSMINLLADALGPGTVGIHGDSQLYFLTSAFMTMVLIFLHTFWGILFFHGCEHQRWWEIAAVVIMHLTVSGLSFCNPLYVGSLVPSYLLMAAAAAWAYLLSGGSAQNLWRFLLCLRSGASPQPGS